MVSARVDIGRRRRLFIFERRPAIDVDIDNATGATEGPFEEQFREWGAVTPLQRRGGEAVLAQAPTEAQPFILTINNTRRTREITNNWRILERDRPDAPINVRSITENVIDRRMLDLLCETGTAA